jgi:hypothetical protein
MLRHVVRPDRSSPPARGLRPALTAGAALLLAASARADHTVAGIVNGQGGPINAQPAGTLPAGMWSLAFRIEYVDLKQRSNQELLDFSAKGEDVHSQASRQTETLTAAYGVSDRFMLAATLPHIRNNDIRTSDEDGGGIIENGDISGLGDLTLYGQWMLADAPMSSEPGDNLQFAVLGGLKLPTGETHQHDNTGVDFEVEHQAGTGSYDGTFGAAVTRNWGRSSLTADALYTVAGDGTEDVNLGNSFRYDLAWGYRLSEGELKRQHTRPDGSTALIGTEDVQWDLALELNGRWKDKLDGAEGHDDNSGGNLVLFSPGVRASFPERYSLFASVGVPVIDQPNGENHETQATAVVGVAWGF